MVKTEVLDDFTVKVMSFLEEEMKHLEKEFKEKKEIIKDYFNLFVTDLDAMYMELLVPVSKPKESTSKDSNPKLVFFQEPENKDNDCQLFKKGVKLFDGEVKKEP